MRRRSGTVASEATTMRMTPTIAEDAKDKAEDVKDKLEK